MKKILYMAMSLDGYIADKNNKTPWGEEEWNNYKNIVIETNNLVIGYQTYKDMLNFGEFEKINNPRTFVFTSKKLKNIGNFIFVKNYKDFRKQVNLYQINKILISGGNKLNSYFLENNYIDEIFLDIEPFIFGNGLKLFDNISNNFNLELLSSKKYGNNSIQLHYVIKY